MTDGIDTSHWNKVTDWSAAARAGTAFNWVKLTEGVGFYDEKRVANVNGSKNAGIKTGGYHFARGGTPEAQASAFFEAAKNLGLLEPGNLAPVLDVESPELRNLGANDFVDRFLTYFRAVAPRVPIGVYANQDWLKNVLRPYDWLHDGDFLWIARYGSPPTWTHPRLAVHQWTREGSVPGVAGFVDRNALMPGWSLDSLLIGQTTVDQEENEVIVAKAAVDDYVSVPCNGKRHLFVSTGFGRTLKILNIAAVRDNNGRNTPSYTWSPKTPDQLEKVNPDQPGPIDIGEGCRVVQLRYSADHDFTVWCA